jgi:hypothetical protein
MARALAKFTVAETDDGYLLTIQDDSGQTLELTATAEQLDTLVDEMDDILAQDDDAFDITETGGRA